MPEPASARKRSCPLPPLWAHTPSCHTGFLKIESVILMYTQKNHPKLQLLTPCVIAALVQKLECVPKQSGRKIANKKHKELL